MNQHDNREEEEEAETGSAAGERAVTQQSFVRKAHNRMRVLQI